MNDPVDLSAARAKRDVESQGTNLRCKCGSEWWSTSGVVLNVQSMSVTGYVADLRCVECQEPLS